MRPSFVRRNRRLFLALLVWGGTAAVLAAAAAAGDPEPGAAYEPPSARHPLGTRDSGGDLARYLTAATARSAAVAAAVTVPAVLLAFVVGGAWGLPGVRPWVRGLAGVVCLGVLGPTPLLLGVGVAYAFPDPGWPVAAGTALLLVLFPQLALRAREEVARVAAEPFVAAARRAGAGPWAVLWQEVWPAAVPVVATLAVLAGVSAVTLEATLGFLCPGTEVPSLGRLLADARGAIQKGHSGAAWRFIGCSAAGLSAILAGLGLARAWVDDRRVLRGVAGAGPTGLTGADGDWTVRVTHPGTGLVLVDAVLPHRPGRVVNVAGGSGSGKTLALRALAGFTPPGLRATVGGSANGLRVLYVPQAMQEALAGTAEEYRTALGIPDAVWVGWLTRLGLDPATAAGKAAGALSGGMAQRLQLALAAAVIERDPAATDVLVLDEPASALDAGSVAAVGAALARLLALAPGLAVLVANHRADLIRSPVVREVAFLCDGRTVWAGTRDGFLAAGDGPVGTYLAAMRRAGTPRAPRRPATGRPAVEVAGVTIERGGVPVVAGVSFAVRPGEVAALAAPSGGGKTSLLDALRGLVPAAAGRVRVLGDDPTTADAGWARRVRLARQNPALELNPWVPLRTILARAIRRMRLTGPAAEVLERACVRARFPAGKLALPPAALSGGLRVRAGLALIYLGDPDVLLLDEPTAGLDPEVALDVLDELDGFAAAGGAVVIADHCVEHLDYLNAVRTELRPPAAVGLATVGRRGRSNVDPA